MEGTRDGVRDSGGEISCHTRSELSLNCMERLAMFPAFLVTSHFCPVVGSPASPSVPSIGDVHGMGEIAASEAREAKLKEEGKVYTYRNDDLGSPFWK